MDDDDLTLPWEETQPGEADEPEQAASESVLTVSEVNRLARHALEQVYVSVQGEVSGLNARYPYYIYFSLRDSEATLPAILPKRVFDSLDFPLEDGAAVVVEGMLTLFEKQGRYQVRVASIRPFGEGAIQRRIEMLKRKLLAEGLFDESRKRDLPSYPERIGVVTSPRGAAVRDVTVTIARRFPPAEVFVRGVRVQGAGAVDQICGALHFFDHDFPVDVVILARGGGSIARPISCSVGSCSAGVAPPLRFPRAPGAGWSVAGTGCQASTRGPSLPGPRSFSRGAPASWRAPRREYPVPPPGTWRRGRAPWSA